MRNKFLVGLSALLLAACTTSTAIAPTVSAFPRTSTFTPTFTPTTIPSTPASAASPSFTLTTPPTRKPTSTPSTVPSATPSPSLTPTFDARSVVTRTPAPAAECPSVTPVSNPNLEFLDSSFDKPDNLLRMEENTLDFLNRFGPVPLVVALQKAGKIPGKDFTFRDLTKDGVSEFAFGVREFYIFGCNEGKYETLLKLPPDNYYSPDSIVEIKDANRDGIPEITLLTGYLTQRGHYYQVYEWDGSRFRNLLVSDRPEYPESGAIFVRASGTVTYQDLDGDGVQELIVNRGIPIWDIYSSGLPWRNERQYFKWDGTHFAFYASELDPPQYRFQTIQDGDEAALAGNYNTALDLYQQAIFSDQLEWWSPERRENMQVLYAGSFNNDPTPTPPAPDPDEYYNLAAYARYRIMLLHVLRGYLPEAEVVFDTLQDKFPVEQTGHTYAEMAAAFWTEYQSLQNIGQACAKAIEYARAHSELLAPLGSDYHGDQSRWYKPEDVCPFK